MNENFRAGVALSVALLLSSMIASWSYLHAKKLNQTIAVTGSAKKRIKSDLMVWRASVSAESPSLPEAYGKLSRDVEKVKAFLVAHGVAENQIIISAVVTTPIRPSQRPSYGDAQPNSFSGRITGYDLKQSVEVHSPEIEKITAVSRQVTDLIVQGILLESEAPEYLYTGLAEAKVELLAAAAKDARDRAQQIAASAGAGIGDIRSAEMGVLQITAADANKVSDYGENDTMSLDKDVTAVVHMSFALN
ncbi:MAG: SIMPL domain-containing protein [Candidatus Acidiferrales bacterium]